MTDLFIPVGIPGCGKSSFGELFFGRNGDAIHSTDLIREELGDINDQSNNDQVFTIFHERIERDLKNGWRVYADATNLSYKARWTLWLTAQDYDADVHLIIFTNNIQAAVRNQQRDRTVPDEAMTRMLDNYERFRLNLSQEQDMYATIIEIGSL